MRRARVLLAAVALALVTTHVQPSAASTTVYVVTRGYGTAAANFGGELAVRNIPLVQGSRLTLVNTQLWGHSIASDAMIDQYRRLFSSDVIPFGEQADVTGVEKLAPGSYPFHCANHIRMRGTIEVLPREGI